MNKEEIINKAKSYSKNENLQRAYIAGFQAACNIVREKEQACYNDEFCDEMDKLAEVAYMDIEV